MAEVHIIDIDGEQWDIKDSPLTERVANLETNLDERITSVEESLGARITSVEESLGARITSVEESLGARITSVEESLSVQSLSNIPFTFSTGYSASLTTFAYHYKIAKIHFVRITISNLTGAGIGGSSTVTLGKLDVSSKKITTFFLYDTESKCILPCQLYTDGTIRASSAKGVVSGSNAFYGELIFAVA